MDFASFVSRASLLIKCTLPLSYVNAEPSEQGLEESCSSEHDNSGFPPYCFRTGPPTPSSDAFDNWPINPPGQEDDPRQGCRQDPPTTDLPGQQEEDENDDY